MKNRLVALASLIGICLTQARAAENWPQFRGPEQNGSSRATNLPAKFSKTENVIWATDLPGASAATPAIWGDHVFVSSTDAEKGELLAICLDRKTGKARWKHEIAGKLKQDDRSTYANPSPATDGERAYFFYGSGDLIAYDFDGKELWKKNLQEEHGSFSFLWTFSASPMLHEGKLYLQVLQRDEPAGEGKGRPKGQNPSYLLALEAATGKQLWKEIRPADAVSESLEAFTTPVIHYQNGQAQMLVAGGDCLTGHDPATGKELWRWGTWNPQKIGHWRLVPSPVAGDGVALVCAPKREPVYAVKLGQSGKLDDSALLWKSDNKDVSSDVSTPAYYGGRFYILHSDRQALACVKPSTGEVVWSQRFSGKKFEASPTVADGKIYLMDHAGTVTVVKAGDQFEKLHETAMGEEDAQFIRSTIAVAQGQIFIRTDRKLYCIGQSA